MNYLPIFGNNVIVQYSVPPLINNNKLELYTNKGKQIYKIYHVAINNCIPSISDECVHDILIFYQPINKILNKFFELEPILNFKSNLIINNVKYDDLKKQGYIPFIKYKRFETKKICKLFN